MIIVTLEFPDERVSFIDHLHASFPDRQSVEQWLGDLERLGTITKTIESHKNSWQCPACAWQARSRVPVAKVAMGRGDSLVDLE